MKRFLIIVLINIFALLIISNIVSGISIEDPGKWETLFVSAVVLSFINIFLKPVIKFITLPINILSFGFFSLFINAFLLSFVSKLVKGFYVSDFGAAFIGALLLSIIHIIIESFIVKKNVRILKNTDAERFKNYNSQSTVIDVEATVEKDSQQKENENK